MIAALSSAVLGGGSVHSEAITCFNSSGNTVNCGSLGTFNTGEVVFLVALYAALVIFFIVCYVKILHKAGYSAWWLLTVLVPVLNIVMFAAFAFSRWPVIREVEMLRRSRISMPHHAGESGFVAAGPLGRPVAEAPAEPAPAFAQRYASGWYPDSQPGQERYHDGSTWTDHVRPTS